jgi:hypothetical protein
MDVGSALLALLKFFVHTVGIASSEEILDALLLTKRQNSYISILAKWEYVYLPQRRNFFVMWLFFDFITVNL